MASRKQGIDKDLIRELAELLKETDLSEIEVEQDDFRIRVARGAGAVASMVSIAQPSQQRAPAAASEGEAEAPKERGPVKDPARHPGCVPSPMVGTTYLAPSPTSKPFVEVGDTVAVGQTILIVEAMKHMNEVAAPHAGKVTEILVTDGQPVEYGQPLMIVE
jgi:acetyl-CoA carboxylase biotin carboxyl carrier protein